MWQEFLGLSISFVLVIILWLTQKRNKEIRLFFVCSFVCFLLIGFFEAGADLCVGRTFLHSFGWIMYPGVMFVMIFESPWIVAHHQKGLFLFYPLSLIFWTVVLSMIVKFISYIRKKVSRHEISNP